MRWKKKYRVKKSKDKIQGYQIHEQRIIDTFLLFPTTALCDFTEVRWLERASILQWYNGKGRWENLAWIDNNKASALKSVDNYNKHLFNHNSDNLKSYTVNLEDDKITSCKNEPWKQEKR